MEGRLLLSVWGGEGLFGKMLECIKKWIVRCYSMCYIKSEGEIYDF